VPSHRSSESWTRASKIQENIGEMPEVDGGNRTEDGKIVQVRSNVACANKWCRCGQRMGTEKCCLGGQMLQRLTNVACSEKCCESRGRRKGNERAEMRSATMIMKIHTHTHTHTHTYFRVDVGKSRKHADTHTHTSWMPDAGSRSATSSETLSYLRI